MAVEFSSIDLPSGVSVDAEADITADWASIKVLVESGVRISEVAKRFKISDPRIRHRMKEESWLTPTKVEKLRKDIANKQGEIFRRTGRAGDINQVKAEIWKDRGEIMREKAFIIADAALSGVTEAQARHFIKNPKGFLEMVTAARTISGEQDESQKVPTMAVSIGLLSSRRNEIHEINPPTIEVTAQYVQSGRNSPNT